MRARSWVVGTLIWIAALGAAGTASASETVSLQGDAAHTGAVSDAALDGPLAVRWRAPFPQGTGVPLVVGDRVYTTTGDDAGTGVEVRALDVRTGATVWRQSVGRGGRGLAYDDGGLYLLAGEGSLERLDADTGRPAWAVTLPDQYSFGSAPVAFDGTVYVNGTGHGATVYAVDTDTGALRWSRPGEGSDVAPAADASGVSIAYVCGNARSYTPAGVLRWQVAPGCSGGGFDSAIVSSGGQLLTRDHDAQQVLDAATGRLLGSYASTTMPAMAPSWGVLNQGGTLVGVDRPGLAIRWTLPDRLAVLAPFIVDDRAFALTADGHLIGVEHATGAVSVDLPLGGGIDPRPDDVADGSAIAVGSGTIVSLTPDDKQLVGVGPAAVPATPPTTTTTGSTTPTAPTPAATTTTTAAPPATTVTVPVPAPAPVAPAPTGATPPTAAARVVRIRSARRLSALRRGVTLTVSGPAPRAALRVQVLQGRRVLASGASPVRAAGRLRVGLGRIARPRGKGALRLVVSVRAPGARTVTVTSALSRR